MSPTQLDEDQSVVEVAVYGGATDVQCLAGFYGILGGEVAFFQSPVPGGFCCWHPTDGVFEFIDDLQCGGFKVANELQRVGQGYPSG